MYLYKKNEFVVQVIQPRMFYRPMRIQMFFYDTYVLPALLQVKVILEGPKLACLLFYQNPRKSMKCLGFGRQW